MISIIIPCYNHGIYLHDTLSSIANVNYPFVETFLIDDGSTDNTREIAASFPWVNYIYQSNKGLPATRNHGITLSKGDFLVFLDADDWLYPEGLAFSAGLLMAEKELAFVSGCHNVVDLNGKLLDDTSDIVDHDHYVEMLGRNYIGNPGTVLYRRSTMEEFRFDTGPDIKGCEDYDLYLRILRKYPVKHHTRKITAYRKHATNMSENFPMMLNSVINVLKRQEPYLRNDEEKRAWLTGMDNWKRKYLLKIVSRGLLHMSREERKLIFSNIAFILQHFWSRIKVRAGTRFTTESTS